ncbi:MAG: hypothetical protein LBG87_06555 [Spirochaetaceae bacterium]|jgi:hypothetical protein|nr:hypothetical protein [Spirochaetaceae bacterium]
MKRAGILVLLVIGVGGFLRAEIRFDLGLDFLFSQSSLPREDDVLFNGDFIAVPELGLYAQCNVGVLHFGGGIRGFSYMVAYSGFWPSVYLEVNIAKLTIHAGAGGFIYGTLDLIGAGMVSDYDEECGTAGVADSSAAKIALNKSIIPEVSLWFRLGKFFRLGGGGVMIFSFEEDGKNLFGLDPRFYLGVKMSFPSERRRMKPDGTQRFF